MPLFLLRLSFSEEFLSSFVCLSRLRRDRDPFAMLNGFGCLPSISSQIPEYDAGCYRMFSAMIYFIYI